MAEYTAIVEAGESLVALLRAELSPVPISEGEQIALCSPHESENNQLTVSLFHVEEDTQMAQVGYYQASAGVQRANPSVLALSFLITAHSQAPAQVKEADQYRILGAAVQTLKDYPVMPQEYLKGSLKATAADVHLSIEKVTSEQMMKIWNNTTDNYKPSLVAQMSVTIDSKRERTVARVTDIAIAVDQKPRGLGGLS